jgi:hypothetical protein
MAARWRLTRLLLEQGYSRADVRAAIRCADIEFFAKEL